MLPQADGQDLYRSDAGPKRVHQDRVAVDLSQRIDKLQNASPYELTLLRVLPGGVNGERELHRRFAAAHVRREWFRPTDDLVAFIQ